jgi:hypothetical protein
MNIPLFGISFNYLNMARTGPGIARLLLGWIVPNNTYRGYF